MSYVVIDGFCNDIDKVRDSVYAAGIGTWRPEKGEVGSSVYEGMGFWGDHALMLRALNLAMNTTVIPNSMFFRVTNEGMERAYIHSDREAGNYTCVCYLTEHAQESGTAFYRHRSTGLAEMPTFADMQRLGIADELKDDMVSRDPDKWEQTDYVRGALNRALVFNAPLFHSRFPLEGIGDSMETGRLVWASHFFKMNNIGNFY